MNKGSSNHYTLLLQDEAETDGIGLEDEEEEVEDGLNGMEEDGEEDDDEEDEPMDDSEEEIFSSSKHRTLSHLEGANLNGQNHLVSPTNEYRLLNNNDSDLKTVLDTPITIWTPTPMSPARRACFIASIMLGILVVATFLWVLPCDVQPCEGDLPLRDREWAVKIEGMGINETRVVQRGGGGNNVLLSYYVSNNVSSWDTNSSSLTDSEQWHADPSPNDCSNCGARGDNEDHCGLLMLDGNLGRENWRIPLRECPVDMQCNLLDISGDRIPDCIVRGAYAMLFMIEARFGTTMWHLHMHKDSEIAATNSQTSTTEPSASKVPPKLLYPGPALLLPDVNNDSFGDLLFFGLLSSEAPAATWDPEHSPSEIWNVEGETSELSPPTSHVTNHLVLVCGQSGSVLGLPLVLKQCQNIKSISMESQQLSYSCRDSSNEEKTGKIALKALLHQIMGDVSLTEQDNPITTPLPEHHIRDHEDLWSDGDDGGVEECDVKVEVEGVCPRCKSQIKLLGSGGEILWQQQYQHSTVVAWAPLLDHGLCHGAILKLWEWRHITTMEKKDKPPLANRRTTRSSLTSDEADSTETEATYLENERSNEYHLEPSNDGNISSKLDSKGGSPYKGLITKISNNDSSSPNEGGTNIPSPDTVHPPTTLESPRARRDFNHNSAKYTYDHSKPHRHHGKQVPGTFEDHSPSPEAVSPSLESYHPELHDSTEVKFGEIQEGQEPVEVRFGESHDNYHHTKKDGGTGMSTPSSFPTGTRLMHQNVLAPPGYQLQQIHERLALLRTNSTSWHEETLASLGIGITQLCKNDVCLPSIKSHATSVEATRGVKKQAWQVVSSSTTFVNSPINGEEHHTSPWSLTSIVRKILVYI